MSKSQLTFKYQRFLELLFTTIFGKIPTILLGVKLRNTMYRAIFARIGRSVYIQDDVELIGTSSIDIGDRVYLFKGVRINARGHENNKICLENGVVLERNVDVGALENTLIHISENTFIGTGSCIVGSGNIKIGANCLIAAYSGIFANNHNFADFELPIREQGVTRQGIVIEDDCWLGTGVKVLDGVTIGQGSVIGAGSVVTKNIPPFSIAVGVPCRVIKKRDGQTLNKSVKLELHI